MGKKQKDRNQRRSRHAINTVSGLVGRNSWKGIQYRSAQRKKGDTDGQMQSGGAYQNMAKMFV